MNYQDRRSQEDYILKQKSTNAQELKIERESLYLSCYIVPNDIFLTKKIRNLFLSLIINVSSSLQWGDLEILILMSWRLWFIPLNHTDFVQADFYQDISLPFLASYSTRSFFLFSTSSSRHGSRIMPHIKSFLKFHISQYPHWVPREHIICASLSQKTIHDLLLLFGYHKLHLPT